MSSASLRLNLEDGQGDDDALPWEIPDFPQTRYQGSKHRLLPWLASHFLSLEFTTALDAFGGTGSVSSLLRGLGKDVTYNDYLSANATIARALLENPGDCLEPADVEFVLSRHRDLDYDDFIERTFDDIYFTREENAWLDQTAQNIPKLRSSWARAVAYFALFQACIIKRPYNLFHRKNLYMRLAAVDRSFGNKSTWDTPFPELFRRFAEEANSHLGPGGTCQVECRDALAVPGTFDLVYVDSPYLNARGTGVDYFAFYHFLEGLISYPDWSSCIDRTRKHLPMKGPKSRWNNRKTIRAGFEELLHRHRDSILVISYRDNGIPSRKELAEMLSAVKSSVEIFEFGQFQYALSKDRSSQELLFVGT